MIHQGLERIYYFLNDFDIGCDSAKRPYRMVMQGLVVRAAAFCRSLEWLKGEAAVNVVSIFENCKRRKKHFMHGSQSSTFLRLYNPAWGFEKVQCTLILHFHFSISLAWAFEKDGRLTKKWGIAETA